MIETSPAFVRTTETGAHDREVEALTLPARDGPNAPAGGGVVDDPHGLGVHDDDRDLALGIRDLDGLLVGVNR